MPHIRSALQTAKTAMEDSETGCKEMPKDTEQKEKTLNDSKLLWGIGKAIGKNFLILIYE